MAGGWYLGKYVYQAGVLSTVPVIIIGLGFLLFPAAFGPLNYHRRDKKLAEKDKVRIDKILELYTIDINFGKEIHDTQEVYTNLKIQGMPEKM